MTTALFSAGAAAATAAGVVVCLVAAWWLFQRDAMLARWPAASPDQGRRRDRARVAMLMTAALCLAASVRESEREAMNINRRSGVLPPAVLFLVDASRSMDVADLKPSRRGVAVAVVRRLMSFERAHHAGLMVFAGDALLACPLTTDRRAVQLALDDLPNSLATLAGGTELDLALGEALRTLLRTDRRGAIVLLSDGESTTGELNEVVALAAASGIPIHTVGMGTPAGGLMDVRRAQPGTGDGPPSRRLSKLDVTALRNLARATSGTYVHWEGEDSIRRLDALISSAGSPARPRGAWLLMWVALVALSVELPLRTEKLWP